MVALPRRAVPSQSLTKGTSFFTNTNEGLKKILELVFFLRKRIFLDTPPKYKQKFIVETLINTFCCIKYYIKNH